MKINISFRQISGTVIAGAFITIFTLYCSGRVGIFLLLALILTPAFSVLITFLCRKKLTLKSSLSHDIMNKGEHCTVTISLDSRSILPCPPVTLIIKDSPHAIADIESPAEGSSKKIRLTPLPKHSVKRDLSFRAVLAGGSHIGIESAGLKDYFGICTFDLDLTIDQNCSTFRIGIIPDIAQSSYDNDLLLSAHDAFASGSSEDTIDETALFFGGFPGYEYREYVPGDSLKRINSKLSAKRDNLMVRLDEKQSSSNIAVILNPYMKEDDALLSQTTLEETLGIIFSLILLDFSVSFYYMDDNVLKKESIYSEDTLTALTKKLAGYIFSLSGDFILPDDKELQNAASMILCSANDPGPVISGSNNIHIYTVSGGEWRHP